MIGSAQIPYFICNILAFIPAIVLHEVGHAWVANKLGDKTAHNAGRISLNPLKHIDPFGTVILPLLLMLAGLPVFGYAKPVPYNPHNFKDPRKGDLLVGLAGPATNLIQALIGAGIAWIVVLTVPVTNLLFANSIFFYFWLFLQLYVLINLFLMFFNILPIPPLDGSSIFAFFCPVKYLPKYYKIQQYALPIFLVIAVLLPEILHVNPIGAYLNVTAYNLFNLIYP